MLLFARNREVLDLLGVVEPANVLTLDDRSLTGFCADIVPRAACGCVRSGSTR